MTETKARISKRGRVNEGRPPKFKTLKDLEKGIEGYRQWIKENNKIMTVERLAWFLRTNRETLTEYEAKEEYSDAIKDIKQEITASKVEILGDKNYSQIGLIFDLCNNAGYSNKHQDNQRPITIIANNPIQEND